jgi:predicted GIY-YIG superfamily endonuclease
MIEGIPEGLATSMSAAFQHIDLIQAKEDRLAEARNDTLHQLLHRIGSDYNTGRLDLRELCTAFMALRAQGLRGAMHAWDKAVSLSWKRLIQLSKQLPNGPEGSWLGEYPIPATAPRPISGIPVVYVLFDDVNEPCYVGSTDKFSARMNNHAKGGKQFVRWQAHPCEDREHAYRLEDRLLKRHKPYLNQKAGR